MRILKLKYYECHPDDLCDWADLRTKIGSGPMENFCEWMANDTTVARVTIFTAFSVVKAREV
jgi:hypothetical protein